MANKKKCLICGCIYTYCNTCYEDRFKPAWYQIFCSEECKEIDGIISANTVGAMSDIEAKHELEKLDLSGKEFHKQKVKDKIDYFLGLEEPEKELAKIDETNNEENTKKIFDSRESREIYDEEIDSDRNFKSKSGRKRYSRNK